MYNQSESGLLKAFGAFKEGKPHEAKVFLEKELMHSLESKEIIFSLKCAKYWEDVFARLEPLTSAFSRGELLLNEWTHFIRFIGSDEQKYTQAVFATKTGVFTVALENYQYMLSEKDKSLKAEMLCRIGLCYKALGNYESAIRFLQDANSLQSGSAPILAELGDCYALCGEEKTAKVLFREAFFIAPQDIDDEFLESELFATLKEQTASKGHTGSLLNEWLPVYGVLFGVFNVKRELRALEAGKLRQSVLALEREIQEDNSDKALLTPRLINHYFWLIDHHVATTGERAKINEILLKIRILDNEVYELYSV